MRGPWTQSASRRSRRRASRSHPDSKASAGSPTTCTGRGIRGRAACWSLIDRDGLDPLPQPDPGHQRRRPSGRASSTTPSSWPSTTTSWPSSTPTWPTAPATGSSASYADALTGPIAYFCAEYGFHESLGIYSGGLGRPRRRPHEDGQRHGPAVVGVGLLYRKGYFRQTIDADGHQEHDYPDYDLSRLPLGRVQDADGPAADRDRRAARPRPVGRGLARPGRPRAGPAARHGRAGERRRRPADHPHPVRPRPRDAPPPGARPRRRRRARDPGARAVAGGLAPQRGPLGVPARRAGPRARGGRADPRRRLGRRSGATASSPSTRPVSAGNERFDADLVRRVAGPAARRAAACPVERRPRARARRRTATRPVRHDRLLAAPDQRRERRQPAPRARPPNATWARHHRTTRSWASPTASTARPGSASRSPTLLEGISAPTSTTSTRAPRTAGSGSASSGSRRGTCGRRTCARSASSPTSPAAGCAASSPATARRRRSWPSSRPRSTRTS